MGSGTDYKAWWVHSRSMLILTLSDIGGPTGGDVVGTDGGSHK